MSDEPKPPPDPPLPPAPPPGEEEGLGYGRPPRQYTIIPGERRNPKGRPKGARGFKAATAKMLDEPMSVQRDGRRTRLSTREVMLLKLKELALKGNMRALEKFLELARTHDEYEEAKAHNANRDKVNAEDRAVIDAALKRLAPPKDAPADPSADPTAASSEAQKGADDDDIPPK